MPFLGGWGLRGRVGTSIVPGASASDAVLRGMRSPAEGGGGTAYEKLRRERDLGQVETSHFSRQPQVRRHACLLALGPWDVSVRLEDKLSRLREHLFAIVCGALRDPAFAVLGCGCCLLPVELALCAITLRDANSTLIKQGAISCR